MVGRIGAVFGEDAQKVAGPGHELHAGLPGADRVRGQAAGSGLPFPVRQANRLKPWVRSPI